MATYVCNLHQFYVGVLHRNSVQSPWSCRPRPWQSPGRHHAVLMGIRQGLGFIVGVSPAWAPCNTGFKDHILVTLIVGNQRLKGKGTAKSLEVRAVRQRTSVLLEFPSPFSAVLLLAMININMMMMMMMMAMMIIIIMMMIDIVTHTVFIYIYMYRHIYTNICQCMYTCKYNYCTSSYSDPQRGSCVQRPQVSTIRSYLLR